LSCDLTETRLHAYLDGELDGAASAEFNQHLRSCAICAAALREEEKLRRAIEESRLYSRAPAGLRLRIEESLPGPRAQRKIGYGLWRWLAVTAAILIAVVLTWRQLGLTEKRSQSEVAVAAAVDAHLRSLEPGHLVDVESTDQHTVKPWFDGKLDFAPPVDDFAANGFPLKGGRLDVIGGRTVAALVYGRRKHLISVFVEKSTPNAPSKGSGEAQGYHWTTWEKDGFNFCAVSDVSGPDLDQLREFFLEN